MHTTGTSIFLLFLLVGCGILYCNALLSRYWVTGGPAVSVSIIIQYRTVIIFVSFLLLVHDDGVVTNVLIVLKTSPI